MVEALVGNYNPKKKVKIRRTSLEIEASRASPSPIQPPHHNVEQEEIGHKLTKLERNTVKRCAAPHDKRVRTRYQCCACKKPLCATCFSDFHKDNE